MSLVCLPLWKNKEFFEEVVYSFLATRDIYQSDTLNLFLRRVMLLERKTQACGCMNLRVGV